MSAEPRLLGLPTKNTGVAMDDLIVLRNATNPHRPRSAQRRRYARLRTGMPVREYVDLIGDRRTALADLVRAHRAGAIGFVAGRERNNR